MRFEYGRVTFESMSCGEEDGNCLIVPEAVNGGKSGSYNSAKYLSNLEGHPNGQL